MKYPLIFVFCTISWSLFGQFRLTASVYVDTVRYQQHEETLDPSDFYETLETFRRFGISYQRNRLSLGGFYDFDSGWQPRNFEINLAYSAFHFLSFQPFFRSTGSYYLYGEDVKNLIYSYVDLGQLGIRVTGKHTLGRFVLGLSAELRAGVSDLERFNYTFQSDGNFRYMETVVFQSYNHVTLGLSATFDFIVSEYKYFDVLLFTEFFYLQENFDFQLLRERFEWTMSRRTSSEFDRFSSYAKRGQVHFGIILRHRKRD